MATLAALAQTMIQEHGLQVEQLLMQLEASGGSSTRISELKERATPLFEAMAVTEEALCEQMSKDELKQAKEFAERTIERLRERALRELPKIGFNGMSAEAAASYSKAMTGGFTSNDTRYSYAVGFIVCHRKCCANGAGNGVAVGIGCYDCDNHVISESCPPV